IRAEQLLVAASQKAYELAEQRFQEGVDDNLTVLDAQRHAADPGAHAPDAAEQPHPSVQGAGRRLD
ncbi:hypothetical protein ACTVYW_14175, partial [Pseudomonas aeruginosa]